jgi:hypothetical protein
MNNLYVKVFHKILDSTIWREDDKTRIVWVTLLAMTDERGLVDAPIPAIADRARVSIEACRHAMDKFQAPDPDSRSSEFEGRRVEKTAEGWRLLNFMKYRNLMSLEHRREYKRLKAQEYRAAARAMTRGQTIREAIKAKVKAEERANGE